MKGNFERSNIERLCIKLGLFSNSVRVCVYVAEVRMQGIVPFMMCVCVCESFIPITMCV